MDHFFLKYFGTIFLIIVFTILTVYDEIKSSTLRISDKTFDEIKALQSEEGKTLFGAV